MKQKMQNLKQKFGGLTAGIILGASVLGAGLTFQGCETTDYNSRRDYNYEQEQQQQKEKEPLIDEDTAMMLGVFGALSGMSPYATPTDRALGAAAETAAEMAHERNIAREGRNRTTVNVYNQQGQNEYAGAREYPTRTYGSELERRCNSPNENCFFTFKQWVDEDSDGKADFNEFEIKDIYKENEEFYLASRMNIGARGNLTYRIINPNGKLVLSKGKPSGSDYNWELDGSRTLFAKHTSVFFDDNDKPGEYTAIWYLNNEPVGESKYKIVPGLE
jgi:hypothetical protein